MTFVFISVFALVALFASAFVVLPLIKKERPNGVTGKRNPLLALAAALGMAAVGIGTYAALGQPRIAISGLTGPTANDYPELIATLARRMPNRPGDIEGWTLLGRGYMAYGNANQAAKAFRQAVDISKARDGAAPPQLLSNYGEALAQDAGEVNKDAEAVFREVLQEDPNDLMARYYVGVALSHRGDKENALKLWESVLADAPPNAPWRQDLLNQMVALRSQGGAGAGGPPNPQAMVAQLASRLEAMPDDINGWLMLIRAYSVLQQKDKAAEALSKARSVFANQAEALAALTQIAQQNSLN